MESNTELELKVISDGSYIQHVDINRISPLWYLKLAKIAIKQNNEYIKFIHSLYHKNLSKNMP